MVVEGIIHAYLDVMEIETMEIVLRFPLISIP
jgi:hypothetical protein